MYMVIDMQAFAPLLQRDAALLALLLLATNAPLAVADQGTSQPVTGRDTMPGTGGPVASMTAPSVGMALGAPVLPDTGDRPNNGTSSPELLADGEHVEIQSGGPIVTSPDAGVRDSFRACYGHCICMVSSPRRSFGILGLLLTAGTPSVFPLHLMGLQRGCSTQKSVFHCNENGFGCPS